MCGSASGQMDPPVLGALRLGWDRDALMPYDRYAVFWMYPWSPKGIEI